MQAGRFVTRCLPGAGGGLTRPGLTMPWRERQRRFGRRLRLALMLAIVLLTGLALVHDHGVQVERQTVQLQAVADLRANQIGDWLKDRLAQARFVRGSVVWAA